MPTGLSMMSEQSPAEQCHLWKQLWAGACWCGAVQSQLCVRSPEPSQLFIVVGTGFRIGGNQKDRRAKFKHQPG